MKPMSLMTRLFTSSALAVVSLPVMGLLPVYAEGNTCFAPDGVTEISCPASNSDVAVGVSTGANTERAEAVGNDFEDVGFSLSVENKTVAGASAPSVPNRVIDRQLAKADVQVKFDGLEVLPRLNVSTRDLRASYQAGQNVTFRASTNFPDWIERAEVLITDRNSRSRRVIARLPVAPNGSVNWSMPQDGSGEYAYTLKVYDDKGRFNETARLELNRSTEAFPRAAIDGPIIAAGEGEDRTAIANIPLHGGGVTVSGENMRPGSSVQVLGSSVPVDASGRFVTQRILPPGTHDVKVHVTEGGRQTTHAHRIIDIPEDEWFYVAIADVTVSKRLKDQLDGTLNEEDDVEVDGRLAFYLKGRVKGRTLITASADTGNGDIEDIFRRLDEKDPRQVLKRLDPEDTYLVYGDDSTSYDDTPTSGRFYIRVERDKSSAVWGDYDVDISSGQLINESRRLYGAKVEYNSLQSTTRGEPQVSATVYAAQPDTRPQRDTLRGTGGSAYFLSRQDINGASEQVRVEIVDSSTGRVIERRALVNGRDYSFDYIQGVIILTEPLSSTGSTGGLVNDNPLGDNTVNLVVDYEYTPGLGDIDGTAVGGQVKAHINDDLSVQVTAAKDTTDTAEIEVVAATVRYQMGESSWVEGEIAQSKGRGLGGKLSTDGGLTFVIDAAGAVTDKGNAYRLETFLDFEDLGLSRKGDIGAYIERRDAGFATLTSTTRLDETLWGFYGTYEASERLELRASGDFIRRSDGFRDNEARVELAYQINDKTTFEAGITHSELTNTATPADSGKRTDLGLRLTHRFSDDLEVYAFAQGTLSKSGGRENNNRLGIGGSQRLSDKLSVSGEISDGTTGFGAQAKVLYQATADNQLYFGYTLDPSRTIAGQSLSGRDGGKFVYGAKYRYNEQVMGWGEHTIDLFGDRRSQTEAYGVSYTPNSRWTYTGGLEVGKVEDAASGNFDRRAISLGASYVDEDRLRSNLRLEYRDEDGEGLARDRETWLVSGALEYKHSEEWRLLTTLDALYSDSDQASFRDGRYVELAFGAAYRPINNEKINALFKLTFLDDQPGEDQVTANGTDNGSAQKSVVLSADMIYDLNETWSLGVKYGYRKGEVAPRGTRDFSASSAHLLVLRADWHVVHKWDALAEIRHLYTEETDTRENGALAGIYRHIGNNAKIGVGYEWGNVSDSVADIDYQSSGIFLNVIGKF